LNPVATPAQQGIWFTERAGVAGTAYHMAVVVHLDGALDVDALAAACAAVVARHPGLGRAVDDEDGVPRLVPAVTAPALTRASYSEGWRAAELARPFDLRHGPLVRFTLASVATDRHVLLVVAHHLVFDGLSKDILVRELAAGYAAGRAGPLPDVDDPRAEADRLAAREHWAARPFDRGDLVLPDLALPVGRVPDGPLAGGELGFDLDRHLVDAVDRAADTLGLTRFELLLAGVHALLRRYGNEEPTVGVDVSTRVAATADHIGLFVNELPITPVAPAGGAFADLAAAVRAELRAAYRFRAVPVAQALGGIRPRTALTRVSISYRRRAEEPTFAGLRSRVEWIQFCGTARNVLHLQFVDAPDGVSVSLQYAADALPHAAAGRVATHLRTLLAAAAATPDAALADLPVAPAGELAGLLRLGHGGTVDYPADATLVGLFRDQVSATPTAVAASCDGRVLTYAELDAASARLAARLRARGVGRGDRVGTYLPRSVDLLVAVLAVARAGAAFVPVDRRWPAPRRELMLADSDPALVLTTPGGEADLPADRPVLTVGATEDHTGIDAAAADGWDGPVPEDLAYVMYTSGSTGRPNGVAVAHRHLAAFLFAMRDALDPEPSGPAMAVWLGLTSLSFDPCTVELFLPLITGGRVAIVPEKLAMDDAAVVDLVRTEGVTHVQATPTRWRMLLDAGLAAGTAGSPVVALTGGEPLAPGLARDLRPAVRRLLNVYGPTETTVWATLDEVADPTVQPTIGRPLPNVRAYVLDADLHPVPLGLPGELCLGGPAVTDGYLDRPELTAERFVSDPWAAGPPAVGSPASGSRLYRTGDLARFRPDGRLAFLGRRDHQIKIRGHRVELGEIEACLLAHPEVARAAVALRGSSPGGGGGEDARLVAYVVGRGVDPAPATLRDHVARALPAVMVPAAYVALPALPMTGTGKLDRRALPEPPRESLAAPVTANGAARNGANGAAADGGPGGSAPLVRQIWQEVLRIDEIGYDEDLFDLGGHSLTITRIMSRIQKRTGVRVPLDAFYDTPTIAEIAELVDAQLAEGVAR
jgi:amino acid adenylation domain-containing protein